MPKAKSLRCAKCGRTFSMPGHLGRHMAAMHGAVPKTGKARATPGRRALNGSVSIVRELAGYHNQLLARRADLDSQIQAVGMALGAMSGNAVARPASRPAFAAATGGSRRGRRREGSLKDYIERVLRSGGASMSVKDITAGVLDAGFQTKNRTLDTSVGIALTQMPNVTRVSRGMYQMR